MAVKALTGPELKALQIELKADKPGDVVATFSRFNVIDSDDDVTLPGAFEAGAPVRILPAHNWQTYMIGKGAIKVDSEVARMDGSFFLNTSQGRDWYESIKADHASNPMQEWSYGFDILEASFGKFGDPPRDVRFLNRLKVHEVSPVTLGAGVDTRTDLIKGMKAAEGNALLAGLMTFYQENPDKAAAVLELIQRGEYDGIDQLVKVAAKSAISSHGSATADSAWDGTAQEANLRLGADLAYYRRAYAWVDPDGDPSAKASYRFIHHFVNSSGTVGAASTRACTTGIGVLNGGRGGTTIPNDDRNGVYEHLARHLRDADREPPRATG